MESDNRKERMKGYDCWMNGGPTARSGKPLETGKGKKTVWETQRNQKEQKPCQELDFSPLKLTSDF